MDKNRKTDPKRILCTMICPESLFDHQGYLTETMGGLVNLLKSMPEGKYPDRLTDEISKFYLIAGGIDEALDFMKKSITAFL